MKAVEHWKDAQRGRKISILGDIKNWTRPLATWSKLALLWTGVWAGGTSKVLSKLYYFFDSMILCEMAVFSALKRERRKNCEHRLKLNFSKLNNQTNIYLAQNSTSNSGWTINWSDYILTWIPFAWEEWKVANIAPIFKKRIEPAAKTIQVRH